MDAASIAIIIGAFLTGFTGLVAALATLHTSARKTDLDTLRTIIETQDTEIKQLNEQINILKQDNERLIERIRCLEKENLQLRRQLKELENGKK